MQRLPLLSLFALALSAAACTASTAVEDDSATDSEALVTTHLGLVDAMSGGTFRCEGVGGGFTVTIAPAVRFAATTTWGAAATWSGAFSSMPRSASATLRWINGSGNVNGFTNGAGGSNGWSDQLGLSASGVPTSCSVSYATLQNGSLDWGHAARVLGQLRRVAACFDAGFYLAQNADVAAGVKRGDFLSGRHHYEMHGRAEGRAACPPSR